MPKKMRTVRTFARTASKSMEKRLVDNSKALIEDPYKILPSYSDSYSEKHIGKIKKSIGKIYRFVDNVKKLEKISNKRGLDAAFAGTLLIGHSEKAPYLGVARFPTGDVTYAQRGRAEKEKLIAVQHFDDPILRLLAIKDTALKKDLHIYSWDGGFFSTGKKGYPPEEFINFVFKKMKLPVKNKVAKCNHIKTDELKYQKPPNEPYLRIQWKSPDILIGICENCSKKSKNTVFEITKYLIETDISTDFEINVVGEVIKGKDDTSRAETELKDDYYSGKITDYDLIKRNMTIREKNLKESGEKLLILDGEAYHNIDDFINKLKPKEFERSPLKFILERVENSIILDKVTTNKVLEIYWKNHGLDAINDVVEDKELSNDLFLLSETPSDILKLAWNFKKRQKIISKLPRYKSLPPLAEFTDRVARANMMFGEKKVLSEIKNIPNSTKAKSISYAFLLVFNKAMDKKWKYSQVEIEYGEFLSKYAKNLLDSKPEQYHKNLRELILASGSNENLDKYIHNE